jgi:anti-sigma regulatory factor (Ser/Thr protein kinase)
MPKHEFSLRMAPDAAALAAVAEAVQGFATAEQLPPVTADRLAVICDELVANVASHGKGGSGAATFVAIHAQRRETRIDLLVEDDGAMFDPLSLPTPDDDVALENRVIGGLGIHLVRSFARDIRYERSDGLNRLHLVLEVEAPRERI